MKELFETVDMRHIIDFIKDISIFVIVFNLLVLFQLLSLDFTTFLVFSVDLWEVNIRLG